MMNPGDIAFPHLGIYLRDVPKSISVFGFEIAFYGIIIATGILLGILLAAREAKVTGQDPDDYWDFSIYAVICSIIGARVYYVVFAWDLYKDDLLSVFNLRQGGLAIYGAVIAAFLTGFLYARRKKKSFFLMADTGVVGLVLGQIIGRWGNFFNREAFGQYTDGLFAMRLPVAAVRASDISKSIAAHITDGINYIQVHPTFLYEGLWNTGVLLFMLYYRKKLKKFNGEIALVYLGGYGLGRLWVEGLRTDQLLIPGIGWPVSQLLAGLMFLGAVAAILIVRRRHHHE